jgi:hypothetical protein
MIACDLNHYNDAIMYLKGARHDLSVAAAKLQAMGEGDGWPEWYKMAETETIRELFRKEKWYSPEMDNIPEFILFRGLLSNWTPRKEQESQIKIAAERIAIYQWVEGEIIKTWHS